MNSGKIKWQKKYKEQSYDHFMNISPLSKNETPRDFVFILIDTKWKWDSLSNLYSLFRIGNVFKWVINLNEWLQKSNNIQAAMTSMFYLGSDCSTTFVDKDVTLFCLNWKTRLTY